MYFRVIVDGVLIIGFTCFAFFPLDKKRIRARWSKFIFVASGVLGIARAAVGLMFDIGWVVVTNNVSYEVHAALHAVDGLLLGFIFSLILSGQLLGSRRLDDVEGGH